MKINIPQCATCVFIIIVSVSVVAVKFDHLHHFEYVQPIQINGLSSSIDLATKIKNSNVHVDEAEYYFTAYGKNFHLVLQKNRQLIPSSFRIITQNQNGHHEAVKQEIEHCYYHGSLKDIQHSFVSINTCNGLNGVIQYDNDNEYFIESISKNSTQGNSHIIYKSEHLKLKKEGSCGGHHPMKEESVVRNNHQSQKSPISRKKRSINNRKYVEVILVMDNREYQKFGMDGSIQRALDIMNNVDAVYKTLDTRVALTGVVVWNIFDKIKVSVNSGETLREFRKYTSEVLRGALNLVLDSAQLVSGINFNGSTVGLAGVGVICSYSSCAINQDQDGGKVPTVTSNTVAHELGHNLGLYHDSGSCVCTNSPCVMTPSVARRLVKNFTDCSRVKFEKVQFSGGMSCVYDYPDQLFGDPSCGNGYVETGEECDCGTEQECKASGVFNCCDPKTCKLRLSAQCADGPCCNGCKFKSQGVLCRDKFNDECDLKEYCTGVTDKCPNNVFRKDGTSCENDKGNCYGGTCISYIDQCQTLWGKNGTKAPDVCFQQNSLGIIWANCGKDDRGDWIPCKNENLFCGKIQCGPKNKISTLPTFPIIGSSRQKRIVTLSSSTARIQCVQGVTSLGADSGDPTIVQQGSKCAPGKMCISNECVNVSSLSYIKACSTKCFNGGVCNSNGNCDCPVGFSCPYCELPGPGGSFDSGQGCLVRGDCECLSTVAKVILVMVFVILPLCVLIGFLCYRLRRDDFNFKSKPERGSNVRLSGKKARPDIHVVDDANQVTSYSSSPKESPPLKFTSRPIGNNPSESPPLKFSSRPIGNNSPIGRPPPPLPPGKVMVNPPMPASRPLVPANRPPLVPTNKPPLVPSNKPLIPPRR